MYNSKYNVRWSKPKNKYLLYRYINGVAKETSIKATTEHEATTLCRHFNNTEFGFDNIFAEMMSA